MTTYLPDEHHAIKLLNDKGFTNIKPNSQAPENEVIAEIAIQNFMPNRMQADLQIAHLLAASPHNIRITSFAPTDVIERAHLTVKRTDTILKSGDPEQFLKLCDALHIVKHMKALPELQKTSKPWAGIWNTGFAKPELPFNEVSFMEDFISNLNWADKQKNTTMINVCWSSHVALNHFHGIEREKLPEKITGEFAQTIYKKRAVLPKGLRLLLSRLKDDFHTQVSRSYASNEKQILENRDIISVAGSPETGTSVAVNKKGNQGFFTAHPEYLRTTLVGETFRNLESHGDAASVISANCLKTIGKRSQESGKTIGHGLGDIFMLNAINTTLINNAANNNQRQKMDDLQHVRTL